MSAAFQYGIACCRTHERKEVGCRSHLERRVMQSGVRRRYATSRHTVIAGKLTRINVGRRSQVYFELGLRHFKNLEDL